MDRDFNKLFDDFFDSLSESEREIFFEFLSFELFRYTCVCMKKFLFDKGSSS